MHEVILCFFWENASWSRKCIIVSMHQESPNIEQKTPEEKILEAKKHLLLFLSGRGDRTIKTFTKPNMAYNLSSIATFLRLTGPQIVELLNGMPGFEPMYKYGTEKVVSYKLVDKEAARVYLENFLEE